LLTGYWISRNPGKWLPYPQGEVLQLWDVEDGRLLRTLPGQDRGAVLVAFLPDGERAVSVGACVARVWDLRSGKASHQFRLFESGYRTAALTPDGKTLLSQGSDRDGNPRLVLHEIPSGRLLAHYDQHRRPIHSIAFSPDGKWALFGCTADLDEQGRNDNTSLQVWDVQRKCVTRSFMTGQSAYQFPVAFSPNGHWVVSGKWTRPRDYALAVWEFQTGKEALMLEGEYPEGARAVAFTPDGKRILSAGLDGLACHDAATGKLVWRLKERLRGRTAIAFSPDGKVAFSAQGLPARRPEMLDLDLWDTREGYWQRSLFLSRFKAP
jgi:WD40 repeat protein